MTSDEHDYANDSKFKSYTSQMDKCLKAFEYTAEWADLISALGRLIKVLQQYAKFPVIPRKDIVGKRLAQCLHPALPAGVHLKAIECYDTIFRNIGPKRLSVDLFYYCTGLFPLLGASAMTVKPPLMDIYESHFLPMGGALKPAFVGLLQSLLPGLEEGAEFYDRANSMLERFCDAVEPSFFYTSMWQIMLQAVSVRQFAISFIINHYNRRQSTDDQLYIIGNNVNLMLVSLCSLLGDTQVLVQRQSLEFVLLALPIHNSQLTHDDLISLCAAALGVLLRRDMSLNRRLYSWLLGTNISLQVLTDQLQLKALDSPGGSLSGMDDSTANQLHSAYFYKYGRHLLVRALKEVVQQEGPTPRDRIQSIRPFRIMTSLLDKQEVGNHVIEAVLLDLLLYMRDEYEYLGRQGSDAVQQQRSQHEFIKTASLFFSNLESLFLWDFLTGLFRKVCSRLNNSPKSSGNIPPPLNAMPDDTCDQLSLVHLCEMLQFVLDKLPIETYSDVYSIHLPSLLSSVTTLMVENVSKFGREDLKILLATYRKIFLQILQHASMEMEVEVASVTSRPADSQSLSSVASESRISLSDSRMSANPQSSGSSRPMEHAIEQFRQFFHNFCREKLGYSKDQETACMTHLDAGRPGARGSRPRTLSSCTDFECLRIQGACLDSAYLSCFSEICHLLVEMTSYPIYSSSAAQAANQQNRASSGEGPPHWFSCLAVSACFADNFYVKSVAVETVIDLIHATRSVHGDGPLSGNSDIDAKSDRVAIVVFPTLPPYLLNYLSRKTHFYECVGRSLWAFLSPSRPQCHQKAVELLYRLHQVCPNPNLCEDIVLGEMLAENLSRALDAHRRFIVLWHLLRTNEERTGARNPGARTFDKCMFVLLDSLDHVEDAARRSLARYWLEHALQTGQCAAILEPLLLRLLQPDTARVSILHLNTSAGSEAAASVAAAAAANREKEEAEAERLANEQEKRIYAISSEGGRVVFHVRPPTPGGGENREGADVKDMVSVVHSVDRHRVHKRTEESALVQETLPFESVDPNSVNLRINPFDEEDDEKSSDSGVAGESSVSSHPSRVNNDLSRVAEARRLDRDTCAREGIQFGVMGESDTEGSGDEAHETVRDILNEMIDRVMDGGQTSGRTTPTESEKLPSRPTSFPDFEMIRNSNSLLSNPLVDEMSSAATPGVSSRATSTSGGPQTGSALRQSVRTFDESADSVQPLHGHLLMYCQRYDANRMLYILSRIKALLKASPCLFVTAMATTSVTGERQGGGPRNRGSGPTQSSYSQLIQNLLARHKKALFGKNFYQDVTLEELQPFRSVMFLEIVMTVCSYFLRGVYPQLAATPLDAHDLYENKLVQSVAAEILDAIFAEVIVRIKEKGKDFRSYVKDITTRCKLQRVVLHCLATSVHAMVQRTTPETNVFSEAVMSYNEDTVDIHVRNSYQTLLLQLILTCMQLDGQLFEDYGSQSAKRAGKSGAGYETPTSRPVSELSTVKFLQGSPLSHQSMLLTCVVAALRADNGPMRHMHTFWYYFLLSSLPHWSRASASALVPVVRKLCKSLSAVANVYAIEREKGRDIYAGGNGPLPPDYCLSTMECLQGICHHTLLDNSMAYNSDNSSNDQSIFSSIFGRGRDGTIIPFAGSAPREQTDWMLEARVQVLRLMPRLLISLALLWQKCELSQVEDMSREACAGQPAWIMGRPALIRKAVLDLLSPLAVNHCSCLLAALAVVWSEHGAVGLDATTQPVPDCTTEQRCLVDMCAALRNLPLDTLLTTVREIVKRPPPTPQTSDSKLVAGHGPMVSVSLLHFLLIYIRRLTGKQVAAVWPTLLSLFKECLQTTFPALGYFLLLKIFNEFVLKVPPFDDRKEQREVQELCQRLLESVAAVAGSSLEQATWFRRSLQVKTGEEAQSNASTSSIVSANGGLETASTYAGSTPGEQMNGIVDLSPSQSEGNFSKSKIQSIQALNLLAEYISSLLDVVYKSEEKEKVAPFLGSYILPNVFPYLRHHSVSNLSSARACTRLLAALSSYQYTRRAWRKEVFDLFVETSFFRVDGICLGHWKSIIDNLLTQDKATLKEMLARLVLTQPGGLNLFTSKEQEYEQGALMMKKLAFLVFASEHDQYVKSMPDIQERMTDCLRMAENSPILQCQAFLCFRVLVVRMSQQHLTSLWHIFMPELVTVLRHLAEDISSNSIGASTRSSRRYTQTLSLYLSACKLLDLALILPEEQVPQFLYYKWSFVGDRDACTADRGRKFSALQPSFTPSVTLITNRIIKRLTEARTETQMQQAHTPPLLRLSRTDLDPSRPLLGMRSLTCLEDLFPFFISLYLRHDLDAEHHMAELGIVIREQGRGDGTEWNLLQAVEHNFQAEFLDPLSK